MMMNSECKKICIICEGFEEKEYFDKLINLNLFKEKYKFITINAKSISNIFNRYVDKFQSNSYHLVLIFCDTDKLDDYIKLKEDVNNFHDVNVADNIIMFGNPCTMQIILSHFMKVKLKSQSKKINAEYIKEAVEIDGYDAKEEQRKNLFSNIYRKNYIIMKENISELSIIDNIKPSTNFLKFLNNFEGNDVTWIDEINDKL